MKNFTLIQKLAVLKSLDAVMMADGRIAPGEERFLKDILTEMDLKPYMVDEARKVSVGESIGILKRMEEGKKKLFAEMMHGMIIVDRKIDEREVNMLINLFREANIDIEELETEALPRDLTLIHLESSNLNIYNDGLDGARENHKRSYDIRIELQPFEENVYKLFISEKGEGLTVWGSYIVEPPVEMELQEQKEDQLIFRDTEGKNIETTVNYEKTEIRSILIRYGEGQIIEYID